MKIYSWNVFCYNRRLDSVMKFIKELDYDVLCLQEVSGELLERLKELPEELAYHVDIIRLVAPNREAYQYVAILSKYPMIYRGTLQYEDIPLPPRVRLFIRFMKVLGWSLVTERGAVYADIKVGEREIRVFSVHFTLAGPGKRAEEFHTVLSHVKRGRPTVIGGDFNVIERPILKILAWLLGSPVQEGLPWYPERSLFEERFVLNGFQNPLRSRITHGFSKSQLDHVLVSQDLPVADYWVHTDLHGSDHYPVAVELGLPRATPQGSSKA